MNGRPMRIGRPNFPGAAQALSALGIDPGPGMGNVEVDESLATAICGRVHVSNMPPEFGLVRNGSCMSLGTDFSFSIIMNQAFSLFFSFFLKKKENI